MIDFGTKNRRLSRKTVGDTLTEFAYDRANQLVQSKVTNPGNPEILPKTTDFAYDAAGRLIREGDKTYTYGYLDKVLAVHENPVNPVNPVKKPPVATFDYDVTGQLASATRGSAVKYGAPGPLGQEYRKMVISIIDFTYRVVVVGKPTGPNATSQTYELYMNIGSLTLSDTMTKYE